MREGRKPTFWSIMSNFDSRSELAAWAAEDPGVRIFGYRAMMVLRIWVVLAPLTAVSLSRVGRVCHGIRSRSV